MSQLNASPRDSEQFGGTQGIAGTEGIAGERLSCLRHVRLEVQIGEFLASEEQCFRLESWKFQRQLAEGML